MLDLDQEIEKAAEHLPDGWAIRIEVEKGYGGVVAIRPDGYEVAIEDGELDITEQFRAALQLALEDSYED